jgi:tetratricopeptide (TPR) repeat protein
MNRMILLVALLLGAPAAAGDLLPMDLLYGTMDKGVLKEQIATIESGPAPASEPERLKRLGIAWHNLAVSGTRGASSEAEELLQAAAQAAPDDMEILAYLGSAQTMVARDAWNVVTKVSRVNKGVALLDKAVRGAPQNVVVRMVRANNSIDLPGFFGRRERALEDLGFLHERFAELTMAPNTAAEVSLKLGELVLEDGDSERARALFEEAQRLAPGSVWAEQAARQL